MADHWVAIAMAAVSLLSVFVTKAGEKIGEKAGEQIYDLVRKKFRGDKEARAALSNFSQKPGRYREVLIDILKEKAETDPQFGADLEVAVGAVDQENTSRITQVAEGVGIAQTAGHQSPATVKLEDSGKPKRRR